MVFCLAYGNFYITCGSFEFAKTAFRCARYRYVTRSGVGAENLALKKIACNIAGGGFAADGVGIRVYESQNKVEKMQIPNALGEKSDMESVFYSSAARILSANAIPTVYEGLGVTGIVFGENAYAMTDGCFENGLIIDLLAAKILNDKGIDVGIESFGENV